MRPHLAISMATVRKIAAPPIVQYKPHRRSGNRRSLRSIQTTLTFEFNLRRAGRRSNLDRFRAAKRRGGGLRARRFGDTRSDSNERGNRAGETAQHQPLLGGASFPAGIVARIATIRRLFARGAAGRNQPCVVSLGPDFHNFRSRKVVRGIKSRYRQPRATLPPSDLKDLPVS
jgi:hypothetical protein